MPHPWQDTDLGDQGFNLLHGLQTLWGQLL